MCHKEGCQNAIAELSLAKRMLQKSIPTYTTGKINRAPLPLKWKSLLLALAALTSLLVLVAASHRQRPSQKVEKLTPVLTVTTEPACRLALPATMAVTGSIAAVDPLTVGAELSGLQIASVRADEGDYVQKGQVLAVLDSSLLQAQLAAARARLSGAQASTAKAIQPNRPEDIAAARQAYQQARAQASQQAALLGQAQDNFENALRAAHRYQTLVSQGAVSQQDADNQINQARTSQAQVQASRSALASAQMLAEQARERMLLAEKGGSRQDVAIARANAAENAAQVRQLQVQIGQTIVRAPDAGLITRRDAHLGDISTAGKPLFEMVRQGQLEMQAQLTQQDLERIKSGQSVTIADQSRTAAGAIRQVAPTVDPATRLGIVHISLPLSSGFMPGMFAKGLILIGTRQTIAVPNSAVLNDGNADYVFVDSHGLAQKRAVTVGEHRQNVTEISSGLKAGESVIVAGAGFLNDGDAVRLGK